MVRVLCGLCLLLAALGGINVLGAGDHEHSQPVVLAPGYADLEFVPPPAGSYALPVLGNAADGVVLDSAGAERRLHDLLGDKIVVLSFIYTSCNDVNGCPLATHVLRGLQERVAGDRALRGNVRLLSFSFDPRHDTPATLRDYSKHFRREGFDWRFVTCQDEPTLAPILAAYDQWVIKDRDAQGNTLGTISHLLRVYLIDRERRIRNIYSVSFLHADTVANDIRTLLAAS